MTLLSMTLLSLPLELPVEKKMVPTALPVPEPLIVQFLTVLLVASAIKRIVVADAAVLAFSIVSVPKPSIVTLSAPFKSIKFVLIAPLMVRVPLGVITIDVYEAEPDPLALRTAPVLVPSLVSPTIVTVIAPVWVPLLMAANPALSVAYETGAPVEPWTKTFCAKLADAERVSPRRKKRIFFMPSAVFQF